MQHRNLIQRLLTALLIFTLLPVPAQRALASETADETNAAGCVSVEEQAMKQLLQMSRNGVYIIIVKNPADIANY